MSRRFWRKCRECGREARMADLNLVYGPGRKTWWWVCADERACKEHR